jgi:quercetin 2,3-dioxygenase
LNLIPLSLFKLETIPMQNRRKFLAKFSLGAIAAWVGLSSSARINQQKMPEQAPVPTPEPVTGIREMGFNWEPRDPFLFCVHHEDKFPVGNTEMGPIANLQGRSIGDDFIIKDGWRMYHGTRVPGFPGHPHRGFETITVVRNGIVDHADSLGASGRYGEGDVQWMTAGKGVQHSEMFPLVHADKENPLELFQIWLNLPRKSKMVEPHFKMLWGSKIPKINHQDNQGRGTLVEVIAGGIGQQVAPAPPPNSWAADPENEVAVFNITMEPLATYTLPRASKGINRTVYFYEGETLLVANTQVPFYHAANIEPTLDLLLKNGNKTGKILILQGKPINEPVIQYGPFVMNTKEEIQQAFQDYHQTQFGGWPWPAIDQVHARTEGRFARHADGRLELGA